jgi:hypothetical protein
MVSRIEEFHEFGRWRPTPLPRRVLGPNPWCRFPWWGGTKPSISWSAYTSVGFEVILLCSLQQVFAVCGEVQDAQTNWRVRCGTTAQNKSNNQYLIQEQNRQRSRLNLWQHWILPSSRIKQAVKEDEKFFEEFQRRVDSLSVFNLWGHDGKGPDSDI